MIKQDEFKRLVEEVVDRHNAEFKSAENRHDLDEMIRIINRQCDAVTKYELEKGMRDAKTTQGSY